jgi:RNA polymerase sigma-70 factor, ECF subfamily
MDEPDRSRITSVLLDTRRPQGGLASEQLAEALYPELRRLAGSLMRRERADHTLQPTALVGEAFIRMVDQTKTDWRDRAHFLGIAARVMRQVLVDHARRHAAAKRGAGGERVTLDDAVGARGERAADLLVINDALDRLAALDERGARVVEMRVFGGLTVEEIAHVLGVSKRTVDADWAMARLWLAREFGGGPPRA